MFKPETVIVNSKNESIALAHNLASKLIAGNVIAFKGDLGTGKSFLCRHIIKALCRQETNVPSPTFNLLQIYQTPSFDIYHFDLYRLKYFEEIYELGIEEAWEKHVALIEWPEIIEHILPQKTIFIEITTIGDQSRKIAINNATELTPNLR